MKSKLKSRRHQPQICAIMCVHSLPNLFQMFSLRPQRIALISGRLVCKQQVALQKDDQSGVSRSMQLCGAQCCVLDGKPLQDMLGVIFYVSERHSSVLLMLPSIAVVKQAGEEYFSLQGKTKRDGRVCQPIARCLQKINEALNGEDVLEFNSNVVL